jgi:segregation and condensation protein A
MNVELQLEKFSGPLDLLLSLVGEEKLDITDIALSRVTEQFLTYIDTLEDGRAAEMADFLVVASRLLLLKSRMLLPQFAPEEDEGATLADQLRLYKQFADAAKQLNRLWEKGEHAAFRVEPPRPPLGFVPPTNVTLSALHNRMVQLIARLTPPKPLPETRIDKTVSVKQKIDDIRRALARMKETSFHAMLRDARSRSEIIVSFLAVLELVKQQTVFLRQEETFGDIVIQRV